MSLVRSDPSVVAAKDGAHYCYCTHFLRMPILVFRTTWLNL